MDSDLDWIPHDALARLTGAHRTTCARWKTAARAGQLPRWLALLVNTVHRGLLDALHRDWRGWMIHTRDGVLVTPEGLTVTQGQIRALPQLYALRDALQAELRTLRETAPQPLRIAPAARACNRPPSARPAPPLRAAAEMQPARPGAPILPRARS